MTKTQRPNTYECSKSSSKREAYSNPVSPQKQENLKQSNPTPKATRERRTKKTKSQLKERNRKDQSRNK